MGLSIDSNFSSIAALIISSSITILFGLIIFFNLKKREEISYKK